MSKTVNRNIIAVFFVTTIIAIACIFVFRAVKKAETKELWIDEIYSSTVSIKPCYREILIKGAKTQGSPAPLDYLFIKFLYQNKDKLKPNWLNLNAYSRLNSIFWNLVTGLFIVFIFFFYLKRGFQSNLVFAIQSLCLTLALLLFYFWPSNFYFSLEMRPYALWNCLWFASIVMFLFYGRVKLPVAILLSFLAASVTASIFQLFSFAISIFFIFLMEKEKPIRIGRLILKYFTIPFIISIYYIKVQKLSFGYINPETYIQYWKEFFHFWITKEMIPILSILGILLTYAFKELKNHTIVFLAILVLYIISPVINYITLSHGFFFSSRQYLYYDLIYPIFLISFAVALPAYLEKVLSFFKKMDRQKKSKERLHL
ncbi:MAG: hypothetical protein HQ538_00275 [Parcubacteria group bacterium]|nr:hypothetical protein [Parcubacteria group bacterium]